MRKAVAELLKSQDRGCPAFGLCKAMKSSDLSLIRRVDSEVQKMVSRLTFKLKILYGLLMML